jgi:regulator of replication initiation timing
MTMPNDLSKVAARCDQMANSPYLQKQLPEVLKNLRSFLELTRVLAKEEVPSLIAEIKWLRTQNKKLQLENETLRSTPSDRVLHSEAS